VEHPTVVRSPVALGQALARLRYERGLTQEELAEALGISRRYVYEVEAGRPTLWSTRLFELLRELGAHLEVVQADADVRGREEGEAHDPGGAP